MCAVGWTCSRFLEEKILELFYSNLWAELKVNNILRTNAGTELDSVLQFPVGPQEGAAGHKLTKHVYINLIYSLWCSVPKESSATGSRVDVKEIKWLYALQHSRSCSIFWLLTNQFMTELTHEAALYDTCCGSRGERRLCLILLAAAVVELLCWVYLQASTASFSL